MGCVDRILSTVATTSHSINRRIKRSFQIRYDAAAISGTLDEIRNYDLEFTPQLSFRERRQINFGSDHGEATRYIVQPESRGNQEHQPRSRSNEYSHEITVESTHVDGHRAANRFVRGVGLRETRE
jgi:hypothetical protein